MKANRRTGVFAGCVMLLYANYAFAQDWPQWRGAHRDAKVDGFKGPKTWPKELTQKWKVKVGNGVATPALVGDKLYVFGREGTNEVVRCLEAGTGKELWQYKYEAPAVRRPADSFPGPRCSPAVADGKVVTLGVGGTLSCFDAGSGQQLWRKDDFKGSVPQFSTSSSPLIVDGLCIAQLGGNTNGAIVAYDLTNGNEKWKWTGDGTAYASPMLDTLEGSKEIVAETSANIVGIGVADGNLVWKTPFKFGYNASTPIVHGSTIFYSGSDRRGPKVTKAVKVEKEGEKFTAKELWSNKETGVQFNTPVLKNDLLFGISADNKLFCINAKDGKTAWTTAVKGGARPGYGSVVDAGSVLLALTPAAQLIVFEPSDKEFKQIASYKVADGDTYAYPVVAGNRVFVKDRDSLILWTIE